MNPIDNFADTETQLRIIQKKFDEYQKERFPVRSAEFFCLELCGEAGELANIEKKRWKGNIVPSAQFSDEAADVFIALMNYCNARGVELGKAVLKKLYIIEEKRSQLACSSISNNSK